MAKKLFGLEQVVAKLRQMEVLVREGKSLRPADREAGITDAGYEVSY